MMRGKMMSEIFQIENKLVLNEYKKDNYMIETENNKNTGYVAIYFSSNGLYFPNEEQEFSKKIIEKNRYEWTRNKIHRADQHIFIRDLFKQWYIEGINYHINNVDKLFDFLKEQVGNKKVITIGSSAGGYAAVLFGTLLKAEYILTFAGQFTLKDQLETSVPLRDPLVFKHQYDMEKNKYYDLSSLISQSNIPVFYFVSNDSMVDKPQVEIARRFKNIHIFNFDSDVHGIPFYVINLEKLINMSSEQITRLCEDYKNKVINRLSFSIRISGLVDTTKFFLKKVKQKIIRKE